MKITFVLPYENLSGGTRIVAEYANRLFERGHSVQVFARATPRPTPLSRIRGLWSRRFRPKPIPEERSYFHGQPVQITFVAHGGPIGDSDLPDADVVIGTWWETMEWVIALPPGKGRKVHFVQGHEVFPFLPQDRTRAVLRHDCPKIAVSQWLRDVLTSEYGARDVALAENAIDLTHFDAPPRAKPSPPQFGFLFSAAQEKNVALAIDALTAAKDRRPDLRALAFGSHFPHDFGFELPDWIAFHRAPPQDEIPRLYASCDAWLFPSLSEGFGLPVLEAMACRTPVIAAPAGAAPQFVDDTTGVLCEPTVEAFTEQILRFAEMPDADWSALSEAARRRVEPCTWDNATTAFETALAAVLENNA